MSSASRQCLLAMCVAALIAASVPGCGGSDSSERPGLPARPGTPMAAALESWRFFQASSWMNVAAMYHPRVLRTLGSSDIMDALVMQGGQLQEAPLVRASSKRTSIGTLVTLSVRYRAKPFRIGYLMRRANGRWRIAYDTLLATGLPTYVQSRVMSLTGRTDKSPTREAIDAGAEAARIYRSIFAPRPNDDRLLRQAASRAGAEIAPR